MAYSGERAASESVNLVHRLKRSLANRRDDVFLRAEFSAFGSPAQVSRALLALQDEGVLIRLGVGVYVKAKPSVLNGEPIPIKPLEVLAPEILAKLGIQSGPSRQTSAYNDGLSTQVPAGIVLNTGKRRIRRKLGFNGKQVQYERT